MTLRNDRQKNRRQARKLAEQAWEAADGGNLDLAMKIIRRAVHTQTDNPQLYNDQGLLLALPGDDPAAEKSCRAALRLAPDFAEACSQLAVLCARQGRLADALAYQTQAVQHTPDAPGYRDRLAAYQALAGPAREAPPPAPLDLDPALLA